MHPTPEKETRQADVLVADGSWSRDLVLQPFLEEEEMVANKGDCLSRALWLYIASQPSVTPAASEFPNYILHRFVIFKTDSVPPGNRTRFHYVKGLAMKAVLGQSPYRRRELY